MNTTPFNSVLREAGQGREAFLERRRSPALLIETAGGKRPTELDGRSPYPFKSFRTPTRTSLVTPTLVAREPSRYPYLEDANVVWVEKSPRSSFSTIISLGRGGENDLRFDIEALSSVHATFARSGERWYVQDHGSKNGTFVNGERLESASLRRLADGDTVRFADALKARFFAPMGLYDFLTIIHRVAASLEASN